MIVNARSIHPKAKASASSRSTLPLVNMTGLLLFTRVLCLGEYMLTEFLDMASAEIRNSESLFILSIVCCTTVFPFNHSSYDDAASSKEIYRLERLNPNSFLDKATNYPIFPGFFLGKRRRIFSFPLLSIVINFTNHILVEF